MISGVCRLEAKGINMSHVETCTRRWVVGDLQQWWHALHGLWI